MARNNSWETQYRNKKHRAAMRAVKPTLETRDAARPGKQKRGDGKPAEGYGIAESLAGLQSSLLATEAAIEALRERSDMTEEQAESLATLEEEAESLRTMLPNIDAVTRKVTEKLDAAESAISNLRQETKKLQNQVATTGPSNSRAKREASGDGEDQTIEAWLESFEIAIDGPSIHLPPVSLLLSTRGGRVSWQTQHGLKTNAHSGTGVRHRDCPRGVRRGEVGRPARARRRRYRCVPFLPSPPSTTLFHRTPHTNTM